MRNRAGRFLPLVLCLLGAAMTLAALAVFDRVAFIRAEEERATRTLASVIDAIGLQASLATDVGLSAALVPRAADKGDADRALRRAIAVQRTALELLRRRVDAALDDGDTTAELDAYALELADVEARALELAAGDGDPAALVAATRAILSRSADLNAEITERAEQRQALDHADQLALEGVAAALFGLLVAFCVVPAVVLLRRRNRQLSDAAVDLAAAAEELTLMSQMAQVAPWHVDSRDGAVRWSAGLRALLGLGSDVRPSLSATFALFEPPSRMCLAERIERAWSDGESWDEELTLTQAAGGFRLRSFGKAIREGGRIVTIASALQGVTEGALARERYEAAQQRLAIAAEGARIGLWDWMPLAGEAWHNETWWRMLGYEPGELPEDGALWASLVHPDDIAGALEPLDGHRAGNSPDYRAEFRMRAKDGSWRWILTIGKVVSRDDEGRATRLSGVHLDFTERRAAEEALAASEERFRSLAQMSSDWYWEQDADLRFVQFSKEIEGVWKVRSELLGKTRRELPIVLESTSWEEHSAVLVRREPFRDLEYRIEEKGVTRWFRISGDPIFDRSGVFLGYRGVGTDATERRLWLQKLVEASREASERARQLQLTLANIVQGLTMFDADGLLVVWNERFLELADLTAEDVHAGMPLIDAISRRVAVGSYDLEPYAAASELLERMNRGEEMRRTVRTRSGRVIAQINTPIPGGGWVTTHEDVTEREQVAARISHAAHHDVLTGLANRASLKMHVEQALRCPGGPAPFSMLLIDLDRFKTVNDTFGHAIGDQLLVEAASRMSALVRRDDVVARLGGDEFAVLTRSAGSDALVRALAQRLLETLVAPFAIDGRQISIGASIGIAHAPAHGSDVDELMRNADTALYRVKSDGRNNWRVFDGDLDAAARTRRELARDLRDAMTRREFSLNYQPIVDLGTREAVGVEALLRWRHERRGMVPPDVFIPLLEETGLITGVGDWVLHNACREAMALPEHVRLAVNVSPAQLRDRRLPELVTAALTRTGMAPERLELEVTETVLLDDDQALLADLRRIKALGVKISLDDFGTGYSSLSYLRMFPFDKIKIDKSFVNDFVEREDCAAIVCSVISLARSLDIVCTAEGVETESQAAMLRAAGCDLAQGYLFARPVPLAALDLSGLDLADSDAEPRGLPAGADRKIA